MMKKQANYIYETLHVLVLPFPVQGHINPMLQFSKRLVSKGLEVTLVAFPVNKALEVSLKDSPVKVEFISEFEADDILGNHDTRDERFKKVVTLRLPQIIAKLANICCLVYDAVLPWALDLAKQNGLVGAAFFTQSCAVNTILYNVHHQRLLKKIPFADDIDHLCCCSFSFPGLPLLEEHDLPSFVYDMGAYPFLSNLLINEQFSNFGEADWVLVNTFNGLEEEVIFNWTASIRSIVTIGPTIPSKYLDKRLEDDKDYGLHIFKPEIDICMNWLNSKVTGSVVYISFGSLAALEEDQVVEISLGLERSSANFLWVVRETEQEKLPPNFLEEMSSEKGMVVSWSPQLEVLGHKAVGCFVTHCGWNSTLEALSLGVPMVAVPQWSDQTTNAKFIADVWEVGVRARKDEKGIIRKEEIERCIREVMEGDKSGDIKRNAEKWKKLAVEAVDEGGSSDMNIEEFVAKLRGV